MHAGRSTVAEQKPCRHHLQGAKRRVEHKKNGRAGEGALTVGGCGYATPRALQHVRHKLFRAALSQWQGSGRNARPGSGVQGRQQRHQLAAKGRSRGEGRRGHTGHEEQRCVEVLLQPTTGGGGVAEAAEDGGSKVAHTVGVNWSRVGLGSFHSLKGIGR